MEDPQTIIRTHMEAIITAVNNNELPIAVSEALLTPHFCFFASHFQICFLIQEITSI